MFKLFISMVLAISFLTTSQAFASGFLKSKADVEIEVTATDPHIKNLKVKKEDQFIYVYGDYLKPIGSSSSSIIVNISFLDAQRQVVYQDKTDVSFVTSSSHRNKKGKFFVKTKYDPRIILCKVEVL